MGAASAQRGRASGPVSGGLAAASWLGWSPSSRFSPSHLRGACRGRGPRVCPPPVSSWSHLTDGQSATCSQSSLSCPRRRPPRPGPALLPARSPAVSRVRCEAGQRQGVAGTRGRHSRGFPRISTAPPPQGGGALRGASGRRAASAVPLPSTAPVREPPAPQAADGLAGALSGVSAALRTSRARARCLSGVVRVLVRVDVRWPGNTEPF